MPQQSLPDWMQPALDGRFNNLARNVGKLDDIVPLRRKHAEIEEQFKQELTPEQFKLILAWEEILNYRHAVEMEWMYGDGMQMARVFYRN